MADFTFEDMVLKKPGPQDDFTFEDMDIKPEPETQPQAVAGQAFQLEDLPADGTIGHGDIGFGGLEVRQETQKDIDMRLPETRETADVGTLKRGPLGLSSMKAAAGLMMSFDDDTRKNILKSAIPSAKFIEREGYTVVDIDGKQSVLDKPGFSSQDAVSALTNILMFVPAAKLAALGKNLVARMGLAAAGSGGTDIALQGAEIGVGSEKPFDPKRTAEVAAFATAGELGGEVIKAGARAIKGRIAGKAADVAVDVAAEKVTERTGIRLLKAQRAEVPDAVEVAKMVKSARASDKTVRAATEALTEQNKEVGAAVKDVLKDIAPVGALEGSGKNIKAAAERAVEAQKAIRKDITNPIYAEAHQAYKLKQGKWDPTTAKWIKVDKANLRPILKDIDKSLGDLAEGEISTQLTKIRKNIVASIETDNFAKMQSAKREMDRSIHRFGEKKLGADTQRQILRIKKKLVAEMERVSPLYKKAQAEFSKASPAVEAIEKSIVGDVAQIKDVEGAARKLFAGPNVTASQVVRAKKIIQRQDPEAWRGIVRTEFQRRLDTLKEGVSAAGPDAIKKALFGNQKQRGILYASVDGETAKNLRWLEKGIIKASRGRPKGPITPRGKRGVFSAWDATLGYFSPTGLAIRKGAQVAGGRVASRRELALVKVMYDPAYKSQMSSIRKLGASPGAAKALLKLLRTVSAPAGEAAAND